ncbi:MAG: energy transducer TonB [candidate division KSB1 bacterium]|nr:energy transducer TonB [candidate division KSB1 bacterium]
MGRKAMWCVVLALALACAGMKPPVLLEKVEPQYPEEARKQGLEGAVTLYLLVSEEGKVEVAWVKKSSGHKILDDAAVEYAKGLRFAPARKGSKPVSVWMSWIVRYRAVPAHFLPKEYVDRIQKLYREAQRFQGEERSRILQEILEEHEKYVTYLESNPGVNLNDYLRSFVDETVYTTWKDFWPVWPLRFAVYHDFVLRFPGTPEAGFAASRLTDLIKQDIEGVKDKAKRVREIGDRREALLGAMFRFLARNYPESLNAELRREAERYLEAGSK